MAVYGGRTKTGTWSTDWDRKEMGSIGWILILIAGTSNMFATATTGYDYDGGAVTGRYNYFVTNQFQLRSPGGFYLFADVGGNF